MVDDKRQQALCFALVDPLPKDMAVAAEWYMAQVQKLEGSVEFEKVYKGYADGEALEFCADCRGDEAKGTMVSLDDA